MPPLATVDSIDRMVLSCAVMHECSSHLAGIVVRRNDDGHDDTPDDELIPSSNIHPGIHKPPRSAFLPLARACHCVLALRYSQMDDPPGRLAVPHFLAPFRTHTASVARDRALAPGYLAGVCFCTARSVPDSRGLVLSLCLLHGRSLHPALPDRPRACSTTGRDVWYARFSARCDERVVSECFAQPTLWSPAKPRLYPVWRFATAATAVRDGSVGHRLSDELARRAFQLGLGAGVCLAPGARRCSTVRRPPRSGPAVWGRASGPFSRAGQHGPGRRDQPF